MTPMGRRVPKATSTSWDAVVLLQMGGPQALTDIEPFLRRLLADGDIIQLPRSLRRLQPALATWIARRRAPRVRPRYQQIGGGSPLGANTAAQAAGLARELDVPVHVAMRYTSPSADDAANTLCEDHARRVLLLPLYPHWSRATTGSSLNDFARAAREANVQANLRVIPRWGTFPPYVQLLADMCMRTAKDVGDASALLLSAHGVPDRYTRQGDPYTTEVAQTARLLSARLASAFHPIMQGFQSAVGPVRWATPATETLVDRLAHQGNSAVTFAPLGFVSDHIETLYDIDIVYTGQAQARGLQTHRVPSLNAMPAFIEVLARLTQSETEPLSTVQGLGPHGTRR